MSQIRGEYWIYRDGEVEFADGDVGDQNHEMVVIRRCQHLVCDHLGLEMDEFESWEEKVAEIRARFEVDEETDLEPLLQAEGKELVELYRVASDWGDARAYAMEHWGWKSVHNHHIMSWTLTPDDRKAITSGVIRILEEEGFFDSDEANEDDVQLIVSTPKGERYTVNLSELSSGSFERGTDLDAGAKVARNQLRRMDQDAMHPFYKGRIGDCQPREFLHLLHG